MRGAQERDTGVWTGGVRRGVLDAACGGACGLGAR